MTIHVVIVSQGDYSERSEHLIAAYTSEGLAKKHVMLIEAWLREEKQSGAWGRYDRGNGVTCPYGDTIVLCKGYLCAPEDYHPYYGHVELHEQVPGTECAI